MPNHCKPWQSALCDIVTEHVLYCVYDLWYIKEMKDE